jgi:hypothetical protein
MVRPLLESPSQARAEVSVPPPPLFRPLRPPISNIKIRLTPYARDKGDSAAKQAGLRYEEHIQQRLMQRLLGYMAAPHLHFFDREGARTLRPDGVLVEPGRVFIFEIKSQHMPEAWWQLDQLYRPVVSQLYKHRPVSCIEIVKQFDPAMPFPTKFDMLENLEQVLKYEGSFGVFQW